MVHGSSAKSGVRYTSHSNNGMLAEDLTGVSGWSWSRYYSTEPPCTRRETVIELAPCMQYLITKSTGILGFCRGRTLKLTESHSIITQHIGHGTGRVNPLRVRVHTRAGQGTGLWACTRGKPVPDPRTRGFKRSNPISRSDPGRRSTVSYVAV